MRRTPLARRKPLPRATKPMKRSRLNPINRERRAKLHEVQFGAGDAYANWLRSLGCVVCGRGSAGCHHVKSRGAGGKESDQVPLCAPCHHLVHHVGAETFPQRYGIDLRMEADRLWLRWRAFVAQPPWEPPV